MIQAPHPSPEDMATAQLSRDELVKMLFRTLGEFPDLQRLLGDNAATIIHTIVAPALQGYFAGGIAFERARIASLLTAMVDETSKSDTDAVLLTIAGELLKSLPVSSDDDKPGGGPSSPPPSHLS